MTPRHLFAGLLLLLEAPILAVLVVGTLITGLIYGATSAVERARPRVRRSAERVGQGLRLRRRAPRVGGPAWRA